MADFLKEAIEMVKAQASLKEMTPEQTMDLVAKYQQSFLALANTSNEALMTGQIVSGSSSMALSEGGEPVTLSVDPAEAIKRGQPDQITCAICGYQGKTLAKHIKSAHGMDAKEYKKLCGYSSDTKLTSKKFSKARSEWAKENKPYEKSERYQKSQEKKAEEEKKPSKKKEEKAE